MSPAIKSVSKSSDGRSDKLGSLRRHFIPLVLMLSAGLYGTSAAWADTVTQLGAIQVSADSATDGTFGDLIPALPEISEDVVGEWTAASTIVISVPDTHFEFDTASMVTANITVGDVTLVSASVTPLADTITFTINTAGTVASSIEFSGIRIRPIDFDGAQAGFYNVGIASGNAPDENLVEVEVIPGDASAAESTVAFLVDGIANANGVGSIDIQVTLLDQFQNPIPSENILLRLEDDNPLPGDVTVTPANPSATDAAGVVSFNLISNTVQALDIEAFVVAQTTELDFVSIEFVTPDHRRRRFNRGGNRQRGSGRR